MAEFVVYLRLTPSAYYALTQAERAALIETWNRKQRQQRR